MLWKFYKTDQDACHYIFGTMHLSTKEAYTYIDLAKKYISKSALYAGEMDLNVAMSHNMTSYFELPEGQSISDYFRPKQYQKMRRVILKTYKLDIDHYADKTPFFISNMLSEASLSSQYTLALDHCLWQFALAEGKEMTGVESFENQVEILKNIPLDYQIKSLKDIVSNISSFRHKLHKLNELYALGKYDQLYKSTRKSMGKIRKLMIYDRNHHMAKRIIELSSEKTAFFAIGAGHMAGGKGLLALLKKNGYKVNAIEI